MDEEPSTSYCVKLGLALKKLRKSKHLSTRELEQMLNEQYSRSTISNYERGSPSVAKDHHFEDICQVMGVNGAELKESIRREWHHEQDVSSSDDGSGKWMYVSPEMDKVLTAYASLNNDSRKQLLDYAEFLRSKQ